MDRTVDSRFERVEVALSKLIQSVATFNPNPSLAYDLVKADAELSKGLEQLSTHQSNYLKILSLRDTSSTLDSQIRETLTVLTATRRALLNTSSTAFSETANPVSYSELLSYARRISKFTLPATYREPVKPDGTPDGTTHTTPKESKSEPQTNGNTPVTATNGVDKDVQMSGMGDVDGVTPMQAQVSQETTTSLPEHFARFLNPDADHVFIPWPDQDAIRRGALGSIQVLLDQGKDPATFDPEMSEELEAEMRREEERQKAEKEKLLEEERIAMERRPSHAGPSAGRAPQQRPAQFQLDNFDEDDEPSP